MKKRYMYWFAGLAIIAALFFVRSTSVFDHVITKYYDKDVPYNGYLTIEGALDEDGKVDLEGNVDFDGKSSRNFPTSISATVRPDGTIVPTTGKAQTDGFHYGFWSLLPALLTLVLAFTTKRVFFALFAGIVAGGFVIGDFNIINAFMLPSLGSAKFAQILIIYLWCLGGLIGLWTRTGGALKLAEVAGRKIVRGPKTAKLFGYIMGLVFHQGGTISTLLAGTTVKPLTDKHHVSHEEISYIIDSTASPVATIIPLNIWPSYTAALIVGSTTFLTSVSDGVAFYFKSIPFNFFALFAVTFTFLMTIEKLPWYGKRMKAAMVRARTTGKLDADGAQPLTSKELAEVRVEPGYRSGIEDFLIPMGTLILVAGAGIFINGSPAVNEAFVSAVLVAMITAMVKGMKFTTVIEGFIDGCKGVTIGAIILGLAVTLGDVSKQLGTATYIVNNFAEIIPAIILPAGLLFLCMFIAFSTGTSLGTYAVVLPLAMPLANAIAYGTGSSAAIAHPELFLSMCFAAVIGGSVYGDECSPISDTTILSSVATGADLMDHVYTQLPLATSAAVFAGLLYIGVTLFVL